jgi:hypothetical protein
MRRDVPLRPARLALVLLTLALAMLATSAVELDLVASARQQVPAPGSAAAEPDLPQVREIQHPPHLEGRVEQALSGLKAAVQGAPAVVEKAVEAVEAAVARTSNATAGGVLLDSTQPSRRSGGGAHVAAAVRDALVMQPLSAAGIREVVSGDDASVPRSGTGADVETGNTGDEADSDGFARAKKDVLSLHVQNLAVFGVDNEKDPAAAVPVVGVEEGGGEHFDAAAAKDGEPSSAVGSPFAPPSSTAPLAVTNDAIVGGAINPGAAPISGGIPGNADTNPPADGKPPPVPSPVMLAVNCDSGDCLTLGQLLIETVEGVSCRSLLLTGRCPKSCSSALTAIVEHTSWPACAKACRKDVVEGAAERWVELCNAHAETLLEQGKDVVKSIVGEGAMGSLAHGRASRTVLKAFEIIMVVLALALAYKRGAAMAVRAYRAQRRKRMDRIDSDQDLLLPRSNTAAAARRRHGLSDKTTADWEVGPSTSV